MERKDYQKPTVKVVKLRHRCHILAGSEKNAQGESFIWDEEV